MISIANEKELKDFVRESTQAAMPTKNMVCREFAIDAAYYEGYGWSQAVGGYGGLSAFSSGVKRLELELNPDSPRFRTTLNRTTSMVQKAAVATQPTSIDLQVLPPVRNPGPHAAMVAQLEEDLANAVLKSSNFVSAWADAQFLRCVFGCYAIGLELKQVRRSMVYGDEVTYAPDCDLKATSFLPIKLTLDPYVMARDLSEHDYVIYSDVWSVNKARRLLGDLLKERKIELEESKLMEMGKLQSFEVTLANLSGGRLFSQFRAHTNTKGVIVHQVYRKDGTGRFATVDILIEKMPGKMEVLNPDDNINPFGGNGLPYRLLHGHRRADSLWSIGETRMLKDDQDRLNRLQVSIDRQLVQSSKHHWVFDRSTAGRDRSDEDIAKRITNAVGGIVFYESGTRDRPGEPPRLVSVPPPQGQIMDMISQYENGMKQQVHRGPGHFGELRTHVANSTYERAIEEAGQVLDGRVHEDKTTCEQLMMVMLGTAKKLVANESPGMLAVLDQAGFDPDEMVAVSLMDGDEQQSRLSIRDGSIRVQSWTSKVKAVENALAAQAITPQDYRREMATSLDSPLTEDDKAFARAFEKIATGVLMGEPFEPMPLPQRGMDLMAVLERALIDPIAMRDPQAKQRVLQAIEMQRQAIAALMPKPENENEQEESQQANMPVEGQAFDALVAQMAAGAGRAA